MLIVYLDSIAIGVTSSDLLSIARTSPGQSLSIRRFVASGVTSLSENPVPPVVRITLTCATSAQ